MLSPADFREVTLADRDLFRRYYARFPQEHSDNTFTNMVAWNAYAHYRFAQVRESIVLASTIDGRTIFRVPIGPPDAELLEETIRLAVREGGDTPLAILDSASREKVAAAYPDLPLHPRRNYFEYVYRASDLAELRGRRYLNIRRQLNRFRRRCTYAVDAMGPDDLADVREFLLEWCDWRDCESHPILAHEKEAILRTLDHFQELGIEGRTIRVDGRVASMALFEPLNETTAVVHFEKGLPDCEGIYKAMNAETARVLAERFPFINRESDLGNAGLRESKMRYHPHHMVEVYVAQREDLARLLPG
ncbi:MAG: phosphatidylglycerol lysyltransferase domain-containing protein [Methanomicrobiales archaeon]|nr:phosphatidylglycerol lysyltransferase domain-containing protein [Methanomicrobiales archaeon]